jgi:hypothetical protein
MKTQVHPVRVALPFGTELGRHLRKIEALGFVIDVLVELDTVLVVHVPPESEVRIVEQRLIGIGVCGDIFQP